MLIESETDVSDWLRTERTERRLSQESFGMLVELDQQLVSLYERSKQSPSLMTFFRLARLLGFKVVLKRT